ncbi:MAG: energy-coupled thiamine transporter ThiT [Lachnospiraceae bacterium]|nr:energy-coupled thiamine transporter ThiT [Lachnospiraceae bacterium]MBR5731897.1 energy-coupled thiamine transporter ThiT [Lachnospiraceae bacterium]
MNTLSNSRKLTEAAIMLAIGTVLSLIKLIDLPYGGSVTIASMLPVVIIAYRHGIKWGLMTGFVFGVIQQLLGLNTLSYATGWQSVVAIILLDYVVAFMVAGFGGIFKKALKQPQALFAGSLFICVLRYICHVITGCTVWAGLSIPTGAAFVYSLSYNATYMIPETIVTMFVGYYIGSVLDFTSENLRPYSAAREEKVPVLRWIAGIFIAGGLVFDITSVFSKLQNGESGEFDITGLSSVSWTPVIIVSAAAAVIAAVLFCVSAKKSRVEAA